MKAKAEFMFRVPPTPNYIFISDLGTGIHISMIDDKTLRKIGKEWAKSLIVKARKVRKSRNVIQLLSGHVRDDVYKS